MLLVKILNVLDSIRYIHIINDQILLYAIVGIYLPLEKS